MLAATVGWVSGKYDLADFLYLVAGILFVIVAVFNVLEKAVPAALLALGLAAVAFGLFVT